MECSQEVWAVCHRGHIQDLFERIAQLGPRALARNAYTLQRTARQEKSRNRIQMAIKN